MNSSGFSLVELMVTVAVMGILATIVVFQTQRITPEKAVHQNRARLTSELTLLRTYSTTGRVCCGGLTPSYGMRIELDGAPNSQYSLYADLNEDFQYTSGDEIIRSGRLEQNVAMDSCQVGANLISTATPPPNNYCDLLLDDTNSAGGFYINGTDSGTDDLIYTLQSTEDPTAQRSIQFYNLSHVIETL